MSMREKVVTKIIKSSCSNIISLKLVYFFLDGLIYFLLVVVLYSIPFTPSLSTYFTHCFCTVDPLHGATTHVVELRGMK